MPSPLAPDRAGDRRALLLLVLLAAIAFWPAAWLGFVWDDDDYVTHNPVLRSAGGLFRIWFEPTSLPQYYPLVHTSFWLEFRAAAALPLLQQALSRDADFYDARVTLAAVLDTLGRHAEAVAEADWVLRRTPTHAPTRLLAAKGLLQLGRDAQAAQNAACVLRSQPTLRPAQDVFVRAFARELRQLPASAAAAAADRALVSGQLDAATLRPRLAAELRSLGASAHADALQR